MITPFEQPIYVTRPFLPPRESFMQGVAEIWDNVWLTNGGPLLQRLTHQLRQYLQTDNLCLYTNGTQALEIGLHVLQIRGEVITTPFTFIATSNALVWNNITPVFADIEPDYYTLDPEKVEAAITPATTAILAVHVFGYPCNLPALADIAHRHGLRLIYDAAHAFGVTVDGSSIAAFGDLSMFSLHATKLYHTIEGGLLTFADGHLMEMFEAMKKFGFVSETEVIAPGTNAKMNEFQALMGLLVLPHLDDIIAKRRELTRLYHQRLAEIPGIHLPPSLPAGVAYNYAYLPIEIMEDRAAMTRDALYEGMKRYNIHTRRYFYPLLTDFACYQGARAGDSLSIARRTARQILTLPLYNDLHADDVHKICDIIAALLTESRHE